MAEIFLSPIPRKLDHLALPKPDAEKSFFGEHGIDNAAAAAAIPLLDERDQPSFEPICECRSLEDDSSENQLRQAMKYSQEASKLLQEDLLEESLKAYKRAADCFCRAHVKCGNFLATVNAAGCYRNMGAVSRLLRNHSGAVPHLQCAEEFYASARARIQNASPFEKSDVASAMGEEQLCLDLLIVETMQSRATIYLQHHQNVELARICHEACVRDLLKLNQHDNSGCVRMDGVVATPMPKKRRTELLTVSLDALCELSVSKCYASSESAMSPVEVKNDRIGYAVVVEEGDGRPSLIQLVAKARRESLVEVARVIDLRGSHEFGMDLFRTAQTMYSIQLVPREFACEQDAADILLLDSNCSECVRPEEGRACLNDEVDLPRLDKSRIYDQIGQVYILLCDDVSATIFLAEAPNDNGKMTEECATAMLNCEDILQRDKKCCVMQKTRSFDRSKHATAYGSSASTLMNCRLRESLSLPSTRDSLEIDILPICDLCGIPSKNDYERGSPELEHSYSTLLLTVDPLPNDSSTNLLLGSVVSTVSNDKHNACPEFCEAIDARSEFSTVPHETNSAKYSTKMYPTLAMGEPDNLRDPHNKPSQSVRQHLQGGLTPPHSAEAVYSRWLPGVVEEKLRQPLRQGLWSLPDVNCVDECGSGLRTGEANEKDSTFSEPVFILNVKRSTDDDDVSDITMRFDDPTLSGFTSQEWWQGVTSDGFARCFSSACVCRVVEAADSFLTANHIHFVSKSRCTNVQPDEESLEYNESLMLEGKTSNVVPTSTRASRPQIRIASGIGFANDKILPNSPHRCGLFSSPSTQACPGESSILSEIASCREQLLNHQKAFGKTHTNVSTSLFSLAVLYTHDRDIDTAISCASEALSIQIGNRAFEDAVKTLHFLTDLYVHQKQYNQALIHSSKVLTLVSSRSGYCSEATAKSLNYIGTVQLLQNNFRASMENHEEALRILMKCHNDDVKHSMIAETLCNIGRAYYRERNSFGSSASRSFSTFIKFGMLELIGRAHEDRGFYKMALIFLEEKLRVNEMNGVSPENLHSAVSTLNGLGVLSSQAGLLVGAIDYYEKAVRILLLLGCDEVHLATARMLAGAVQFQLGNWTQALKLLQVALPCLKNELGNGHETVAATHYEIGIVRAALCDHDIALDAFSEALEIQVEIFGDEHPATLRTRRAIGNLYAIYAAEVDAAFEHFKFILDVQKRIHGEKHPDVAETLHSMGCGYATQLEYAMALLAFEECYNMRVEFLGFDHPLQATTLHDIAKIHHKRGSIDIALQICDIVLDIRGDTLSERHIDIAMALATKGSCLVAHGDTDTAMTCLTKALSMAEESVGESHPSVADVYTAFGGLYLRTGQYDAAEISIKKALDIYHRSNLDNDYYGIQDAMDRLTLIEQEGMLCELLI